MIDSETHQWHFAAVFAAVIARTMHPSVAVTLKSIFVFSRIVKILKICLAAKFYCVY